MQASQGRWKRTSIIRNLTVILFLADSAVAVLLALVAPLVPVLVSFGLIYILQILFLLRLRSPNERTP